MMRIASFELFLAACFFTALLPAQTQFWDKSSGPFGGSILTFYVHSDGRIFTGVNSVGAFVSSDNGVTWSPFNTNLLTYFPSSFVADASGYIYTTGDIGVSKSPISSPSWTVVYGNNGSTLPVNVLAIGAGGILYAGTAINGLAKSTNGGATWVTLGGGAPQTNYQCLLVTSFGHIFAGTVGNGPSDGIFRSTDSGISWKMVSKPSQFRAVFSIVQKGADLFAATTSGIFRSSDIGNTWTSVPGPFGQRFVLSLVAGSDGALLAGTEGGGFFISTDNGSSWIDRSAGLPACDVKSICSADGTLLAGITARGVYRSTDMGLTWVSSSRGLTVREITSILAKGNGEIFAASTEAGVFRTTDNGLSWAVTGNGISLRWCTGIVQTQNGKLLLSSGLGLYNSASNGDNWFQPTFPIEALNAIVKTPSQDLLIAGTSGIYRSSNDGYSWNHTPLPAWVRCVAGDAGGLVLAGTEAGVYRSLDTGKTFERVTESWTTSVLVSPSGVLFAGTQSGFLRSTDTGATWTTMDWSKFPYPVSALGYDKEGSVFAGLYRAVYRTDDDGESWMLLDNVHLTSYPMCFAVDGDGFVYIGTAANGIFRSVAPVILVVERTGLPLNGVLVENYPNPFNPSTTIRYHLPARSHVTLEIFDMIGQRVATLIDGMRSAGEHQTEWNGWGKPSGVYLLRLTCESGVETRKLVFVR